MDLTYAEDGRTLKSAKLMDNASVDLPGQAGAAGRRVAGRTIDIAMGSDGNTVTGLNAAESVQVDLPADGDSPARRIRSALLAATGAEGAGLQNAVFTGNVDFHETRAATKGVAAIERTATVAAAGRADEARLRGRGTRRLPRQRAFHRRRRDDRRLVRWRSTPSRRIVSSSRPRRPVIRVRGPTSRTDA